jgi:plastocyanin
MAVSTTTTATARDADTRPDGPTPYSRTAAFGLLLIASAPLLILLVTLATGGSLEDAVLFIPAIAIPLVAAALVFRFGLWAKIVGLIVALLAAAVMYWTVLGLTFPASFGDFVPGMAFVIGFVLAVGGAIAAIIRRRATAAATPERRIIGAAGALVAAAAVVSGALGLLGREPAPNEGGTPVTMADFAFAEGTYEMATGEPARMVVHNRDGFVHDIAIPELGVDKVAVLPGRGVVVDVPAPAAGTYTVYCTLHSNLAETDPEQAGMAALLVVE